MDGPVDLEQCLGDTPAFRAGLNGGEQDMHRLETMLEKIIKLANGLLHNGKAFSASNSVLIGGFNSLKEYFNDNAFVSGTLGQFVETLSELQSLYKILFDQFQRVLADGVREFIRRDVRTVKDTKKVFDKTSSDLDSVLQKNSHASRSKPQEGEEASKQLSDTSVAFRHTALDYGYQVNLFHMKKGHRLLHTMLSFMEAQSTFFRHGYDVLKESQPIMKTVGEQLDELSGQITVKEQKLMEQRRRLTVQATDYDKLCAQPESGVMMRGYLWKRGTNAFKTWNRRYFFIQNNQLLYQNRSKGDEVTVLAEDLRLCTLKPADDQLERRFCFEVILPTKTVMVQADSEELRMAWIAGVQRATALALGVSPANTAEKQASSTTAETPDSAFSSSEKRTAELKRVAGNDKCADCDSPDPTWASINLGVTLCIDCSGVHRSLGVQISKVRSLTLDQWEPETGRLMTQLGNFTVNGIFEQNTEGWRKPTHQSSSDEREAYIRAKYVNKLFRSPDKRSPTPRLPQRKSIPLTVVTGSESEESDENPDEDSPPKQEVNFDSPRTLPISIASEGSSPETPRKANSQPVSPMGVRRWTVSKLRRKKGGLDVPQAVDESASISDTETLSLSGGSRRKKVLRKLKKFSPRRKVMTLDLPRDKQDTESTRSSEHLRFFAAAEENPSEFLCEAVKSGDVSQVLLALSCGADVNLKNGEDQQPPLHQAVLANQILAMEFLLQNGAKVNQCDKNGRTALHLAAQNGSTGHVCLLLKRGANQDAVDNNGQDPLAIALSQTHADIVTLLRLAKLNKDMKENDETTEFDSYKAIFNDFSRMAFNSPERLRRSSGGD